MLGPLQVIYSTLQQAAIVIFHFFTVNNFQQLSPTQHTSQPGTMKHIVILGGSYAGINTAHRILKQNSGNSSFKITIVSPNTHLYWNFAVPRGILPGVLGDDQLFQAIAPGFKKYPGTRVELVLGSAENLDNKAKEVTVALASGGNQTIDYDILILATGSRMGVETPFKNLNTTEETRNALHAAQAQIKESKTIVVAGGGVTGVEVAGELAAEYGQRKEVILIASGPTLLQGSPMSVQKYATKELRNLNVNIKFQTKVVEVKETPDGSHELTLSSGDKLAADMYIPAYGIVPNSSYVPDKFLDAAGFVMVDENLSVKGADGVFAIGDVNNVESPLFLPCDRQSVYLAKSITAQLSGKTPAPYKAWATKMMGFQIGRTAGTGHYGNWKMPTFLVVRARKNLFIQNMGPTINGTW
ncbi:hypothetical protein G7046_g2666 [Stylonectria norvegica]|nr:hypothetical protein G7046_g2666 [Stylonectria norvegica]